MPLGLILVWIAALYSKAVWINEYLNWDEMHLMNWAREGGVSIAFGSYPMELYMPLPMTSWYIEQLIFGQNPVISHGINLALHLGCVALVWYGLRLLTGNKWIASMTALLWGVHPINVETVLWGAARKDLMVALFVFTTLVLYLKKKQSKYIGYIAACLSKASAVSLPLVLWMHRPREWKQYIGFFGIAFVTGIIALNGPSESPLNPLYVLSILPVALLLPLSHVAFPYQMTAMYSIESMSTELLLGTLTGVALVLAFAYNKGKLRYALLALGWYVLWMLPSIANKHEGSPYVTADHYAYIACLGCIMLFVYALSHIKFRTVIVSLIAVGLSTITYRETAPWENYGLLFYDIVVTSPESELAYVGLAEDMLLKGHEKEAVALLEQSIKVQPNTPALYALGRLSLKNQNYDQAILYYDAAMKADTFMLNKANVYADLGALYLMKANPYALELLERALELNPNHAEALHNIEGARLRFGNTQPSL